MYQEPKEPPLGRRAAVVPRGGEGRAVEGSKQGCWVGGGVKIAGLGGEEAMAVDLEGR